MKLRAILWVLPAVLALPGCLKPEPVIYRVSLGMTEARLMEAIGPPLSVQEEGGGRVLEYRSWGKDLRGRPVNPQHWYVHVANGHVDAYGRHKTPPATGGEAPKAGS